MYLKSVKNTQHGRYRVEKIHPTSTPVTEKIQFSNIFLRMWQIVLVTY